MTIFGRAIRKFKRVFGRFHLDKKLWLFALGVLPQRVAFGLWHRSLPRKMYFHMRKAGARVIQLQDAYLIVHWSDFPPVGSGPSASLYVLEEEVMRIDCFGGIDGHMHFNPEQDYLNNCLDIARTPRIYFPEGSRQEHVDRAVFELKRNAPTALAMNVLPMIQNYSLATDELDAAAEQMRGLMTKMLVKDLVAV
ncbi:hypothetical protein N836_08725 [Leptolyngbya sp. Heron Island J]|uniref:hypothetical protein n=1 Tax=Leptolyngbya sp. Heron Island J TaxID=1385935 RepID=UPI0003B9B9C1|nr:hypothetical protein [Leptolyngbya sp. Heron Island J]ESA36054.1 hypothetical protein N836_08725 [Leptolyngbya sp. Heron Island J]